MAVKKIEGFNLHGSSDKEFILIHGYTGGPLDFEDIPHALNEEFDATVKVMKLKGHGTKVEDLYGLHYKDFLRQVREKVEESIKEGKKIIVAGYSFGGLLALEVASRYDVAGVVAVCAPIKLRFPLNLRIVSALRHFKKKYKKIISDEERSDLAFSYYYDQMPSVGLKVCQDAGRDVKKHLHRIRCPVLSVFSGKDVITSSKGTKALENKLVSKKVKNVVVDDFGHRPSSKEFRELIKSKIISFAHEDCFKDQSVRGKKRVSAIIPAYNEEERISHVLEQIKRCPAIHETVVVDDGSSDRTSEVVRKFKGVKLIRNVKNMGKAYSMDAGVKATDSEIIFFCDADLDGFRPEMVEQMVDPILRGGYDMFIGIRKNKMQRAVKLFALNSGERALRREIWENLPEFYKNRYRIEAGLNYYAKFYGKGYGYETFPYFQTLKETKYGFLKGTILRWKMNLDVLVAYMHAYLYDLPLKKVNGNQKTIDKNQKSPVPASPVSH